MVHGFSIEKLYPDLKFVLSYKKHFGPEIEKVAPFMLNGYFSFYWQILVNLHK